MIEKKDVDKFVSALAETRIIEIVRTELFESEPFDAVCVTSRPAPNVTEEQWVEVLVRPLRIASLRYKKEWSLITSKRYVDKNVDGRDVVVYAWIVEIRAKDLAPAIEVLTSALLGEGEPDKEVEKMGVMLSTEEVITRPLPGYKSTADINKPPVLVSEYEDIHHHKFRPGAGATPIKGS